MRLKFLLRPGWIAAILLIVVFSALCFTVLAPWQFGRNDEAQTRNAAIQESFDAQPRPLDEVLPPGRTPDASVEWTKVDFSGEYVPAGETLAWQRTVQGEAAFEILTPFRLDSGETVLVNRGYVRPVEAAHAPPYPAPPAGRVTVQARVRLDEFDGKHRPTFFRDGQRWAYAINTRTLAHDTGIPLRPGYFALAEGQPGVLAPLPLPRLETGPYFSYAFQWITFGIMAPLAIGYLIYAESRPGEQRGELAAPTRRSRRMSVAEAIAEDERREREEQKARG